MAPSSSRSTTRATARAAAAAQPDPPEGANEVRLLGRVSAEPVQQQLPSGDHVVTLRLVVPRPRAGAGASPGPSVDTIDVACWSGRTRTTAQRLHAGDHAEVSGALRRRFFRAGGAAVSRYEVEASVVRRVRS